ncbi:MAG: DUF1772 domain-containing protein [Alphaproteobacteria bacterium]
MSVADSATPGGTRVDGRGLRSALFIAVMATALALGGALAHLYALPNKIGMTAEDYFVAQQAYRGWNATAALLAVELGAMVVAAVLARRRPAVLRPVVLAIAGLLAAQAVFWVWTFPANTATAQWTAVPADWQALRAQWEWSHAAGALFQLIAMGALSLAAIAVAPPRC